MKKVTMVKQNDWSMFCKQGEEKAYHAFQVESKSTNILVTNTVSGLTHIIYEVCCIPLILHQAENSKIFLSLKL